MPSSPPRKPGRSRIITTMSKSLSSLMVSRRSGHRLSEHLDVDSFSPSTSRQASAPRSGIVDIGTMAIQHLVYAVRAAPYDSEKIVSRSMGYWRSVGSDRRKRRCRPRVTGHEPALEASHYGPALERRPSHQLLERCHGRRHIGVVPSS